MENKYDISEIEFIVDTASREDLIEEFIRFLDACGYATDDLKEAHGL